MDAAFLNIACRFTTGETAALAVIALEASKRGNCQWTIGHIAAVAGVSDTTVKRAIREAKALAEKKAAGMVLGNRTNLPEARAKGAAANRADADAFASNVLPIIR